MKNIIFISFIVFWIFEIFAENSALQTPNKIDINKHYSKFGKKYNNIHILDDQKLDWFTDKIISYLQLNKKDMLSDIGGGTCKIATIIYNKLHLEKKIICVDPSRSMLFQSKDYLDAIIPLEMDANDFLKNNYASSSNAFLIKESIHHIDDLQQFLDRLSFILDNKKEVLIIMRKDVNGFNLFKDAIKLINLLGQDFFIAMRLMLINSELEPKINYETFIHKIEKAKYFQMLKERFFSSLIHFDDQTLDKGIKEINRKYLDQKFITIKDELLFIKITNHNSLNSSKPYFHQNNKKFTKKEEAIITWLLRQNHFVNNSKITDLINDKTFIIRVGKISNFLDEKINDLVTMSNQEINNMLNTFVQKNLNCHK